MGQRPVDCIAHVPFGEGVGVPEQRVVGGPEPVEVVPSDRSQLGVIDPGIPPEFHVLMPLVPGVQRPRNAEDNQFALAHGQPVRVPQRAPVAHVRPEDRRGVGDGADDVPLAERVLGEQVLVLLGEVRLDP